MVGTCSMFKSSRIECARGERCAQWNRNPESVGYGSPGKYLETGGLRGVLLCEALASSRVVDSRSSIAIACQRPLLPSASVSAYSKSIFEPASSGSVA